MQPSASLFTRAALAVRFFSEVNEVVTSCRALAEVRCARTLSDLFYLQAALLTGGFIHAWPDSAILEVIDTLPSSTLWRSYISVYDEDGTCVHSCAAAEPLRSAPAACEVFVLTADTEAGIVPSVYATRESALKALERMLREYSTFGAAGAEPRYQEQQIADMVSLCDRTGEVELCDLSDHYTIEMREVLGAAEVVEAADSSLQRRSDVNQPDPAARGIALAAAAACLGKPNGRHIERLVTSRYFTADFEGEDLVVAAADGRAAADLFAEIERAAGAKLVCRPDLGTAASAVLGFTHQDAQAVLERLA